MSGSHETLHPGVAVPHPDFVASVGSQASVPLRAPSPQKIGALAITLPTHDVPEILPFTVQRGANVPAVA